MDATQAGIYQMDETRPLSVPQGLDSFQKIRIQKEEQGPLKARRRFGCSSVLLAMLAVFLCLFVLLGVYVIAPMNFGVAPMNFGVAPTRTTILVMGIDGGLGRGDLGRTDTMLLLTFSPLDNYVGMLSIPRDLWVPIAPMNFGVAPMNFGVEGVGENRINTAYFFAEANAAGSGVEAAKRVIEQNFNVPIDYYMIVKMDGLLAFIDALGGVDVTLSAPAAGLEAGRHHLNGEQALAFARSRANADDFSRMKQGQILIKGVIGQLANPVTWVRLPEIKQAFDAVVRTDVPILLMPRLGLALMRTGLDKIDSRSIGREMTTPFTTNQGAMVLLPVWEKINPLLDEMFGKR